MFVFLPYIPFIHHFHPTNVPTYLRLYFVSVLALQPRLYRLAHLCHIHVYIPFPAFHPHVSRATFLVIKLLASSRSDNSHSHSHSLIPTPSTLPPRPRPWLLKSNGYILSTFCFSIGLSPYAHNIRASYSTPPSYGTASLLARLFVSHISILLFPIRSCSLRSAL